MIITKLHPDNPERIELFNPDTRPVELAGGRVEFVADGKAPVVIKQFTAGQVAPGSFITLGDDTSQPFDGMAKNRISLNGTLRVVLAEYEEELKVGEATDLKLASLKTGQRLVQRCQPTANEFIITAFDPRVFGAWPDCQKPEPPAAPEKNDCVGLRLHEIGAYTIEQFIELRNTGSQSINVAGCQVAVGRSATRHVLVERDIAPGEIMTIWLRDSKLKLAKTAGTVYLLTAAGEEIDDASYEKLAKGTSWALIDGEWRQTHAPTPGEVNHFQRWQTCEPGKHINEDTGNCVKIPSPPASPADCAPGYYRHPETGRCRKTTVAKAPAPCKEGQYRSEETGRCRSIASAAAKMLKPCKDGYFRSPETGRCRKIAADRDVLKQCAEGYERNPTTKRCRKIRTTAMPTAGFAPQAAQQVAGATWGWWVFGGVSLLAVGYGIWQWRWELGQMLRRVGGVFTAGKK